MKKGTRNLLIVGAAGLAGYFFIVKPALDKLPKTPAEAGQAAGEAAAGGLFGFLEGIIGAATAPFQAIIDSLMKMVPQPSPIAPQTPSLATSFNNSNYSPNNVGAYLTAQSTQVRTAQQFGVPVSSINPNVNYLGSVGAGVPAATWNGQSGTYQSSTGTFTSTSGLQSSVASYLVKPAASYAPATKVATYAAAPANKVAVKDPLKVSVKLY